MFISGHDFVDKQAFISDGNKERNSSDKQILIITTKMYFEQCLKSSVS